MNSNEQRIFDKLNKQLTDIEKTAAVGDEGIFSQARVASAAIHIFLATQIFNIPLLSFCSEAKQ